ncbi:Uncharacterised protein [Serratia fonticola]|nr:Uncharacterised protein [Serratia fonticola]CAI1794760.1 Uncharacterised protein [Serratia fonticola]CAI1795592.1 Uncharacterised protein [Serratia fonticola]CAI1844453.1 Uncharacterised protein [Serratia fonticola]
MLNVNASYGGLIVWQTTARQYPYGLQVVQA